MRRRHKRANYALYAKRLLKRHAQTYMGVGKNKPRKRKGW